MKLKKIGLTPQPRLFQIERENRHLEIAGPSLRLVEEQDANIFLADIDLGGVGLARARHDANALGVELAPQIGFKGLEILDVRGLSERDLDLEIVGTLLVLVVDGNAAYTL